MFFNIHTKYKTNWNIYWTILQINWQKNFAYPLSFFLWRVRQIILFVITFSLWDSLYASSQTLFGYEKTYMLTYIFMANVVQFFVLSSKSVEVANIIHSGDLSLYLLKPLRFFKYWFTVDIADKLQNVFFGIIELSLLFFLFLPQLYIPHSIVSVLLTLLLILGGVVLFFIATMLIGFVGFWSPDYWAPRFLFMMILQFTSGSFFPLDIFPPHIVKALLVTPFPYFMYFQTKIWLEQLDQQTIVLGIGMLVFWIVFLWLCMKIIWNKGLRRFGAEGR